MQEGHRAREAGSLPQHPAEPFPAGHIHVTPSSPVGSPQQFALTNGLHRHPQAASPGVCSAKPLPPPKGARLHTPRFPLGPQGQSWGGVMPAMCNHAVPMSEPQEGCREYPRLEEPLPQQPTSHLNRHWGPSQQGWQGPPLSGPGAGGGSGPGTVAGWGHSKAGDTPEPGELWTQLPRPRAAPGVEFTWGSDTPPTQTWHRHPHTAQVSLPGRSQGQGNPACWTIAC